MIWKLVAKKVTEWFHLNKMIVSGENTKLIITGTNVNRLSKFGDSKLKVTVDEHEQSECESEKLLGIIVSGNA